MDTSIWRGGVPGLHHITKQQRDIVFRRLLSCRCAAGDLHACKKKYTVNFAYSDTRRGIKKVSLFAKCRYTRSLIICITVGRDFALGMEMLSVFANCRYIREVNARYFRRDAKVQLALFARTSKNQRERPAAHVEIWSFTPSST